MFKNYLKTALRNLKRRKNFTLINIAGLALGLCAALMIGLFVWDEHQYDKFIPHGDQVFRIYDKVNSPQGISDLSVTPPAFTTALQQDFPEVEGTTRVMMQGEYKSLFEAEGRQLYEQKGFFVDSTFFSLFPLSFVYGSPSGALNDPASIVLSTEMSQRFFGSGNPLGKKMLIEKQPVLVKGVFVMDPKFHLQFNYLRPLAAVGIPIDRMQSWQWQQFFTYVKIKEGSNINAMRARFQQLVKQRLSPKLKMQGVDYLPFFQPLRNIHLYSSDFKFDVSQRGNITYVNALVIISIFILLIACFNFINLSTAISVSRAREVGVRKAIGAEKRQLILQFLGESMLLAFCGTVLAVLLTMALLPWLNHFTGKTISFALLFSPVSISLFLALAVLVGLLAGFYPALVLSRFDPVKVLKSNAAAVSPGRTPWLRHSLVVIQFTLSILLVISAIIVFRQVAYLHHKDLGFSKEQIMFFPMRGDNLFKTHDAFKTELLQTPGVTSVSVGYGFPGDAVAGDEIISESNGEKLTQSATQLTTDFDYIKTLGLKIIAGRDFSRDIGTDKDHAWILNETAVKTLGFGTPERALGQTLYWHPWDGNNPDSLKVGKVIGVVKDFNYKSLYDKIEPAVLQIYPQAAWKVAVKIKTADLSGTIARVTGVWNQFATGYPLEFKFLDQNFDEMYRSEDKLESLLWVFTGIAIFIGCLGLFGLAAYTAETRRREMGIRKILGATAESVVVLLSKDFVRLVLISLVIASPITWYFMNHWLEGFAYRVSIAWWIFVLAGSVAVLIAILTVSYQALRTALANPVNTLRSE